MSIENKDPYDQSNSQAIPQGETPERNDQNPTETQEISAPLEENNGKINQKEQEEKQEEENLNTIKKEFPALSNISSLKKETSKLNTLLSFKANFTN